MPRSIARLPTRRSMNMLNDNSHHAMDLDSDSDSSSDVDNSDALKTQTSAGAANGTSQSDRLPRRRVSTRLPPTNATAGSAAAAKRLSLFTSTSQTDASSASSSPRQLRTPSKTKFLSLGSTYSPASSPDSDLPDTNLKSEHSARDQPKDLGTLPHDPSPSLDTPSLVASDNSSSGLSSPALVSSVSSPTPSPARAPPADHARRNLQPVSPSTFFSTSSAINNASQPASTHAAVLADDSHPPPSDSRPQLQSNARPSDEPGTPSRQPPAVTRLRYDTTAAMLASGDESDASSDLSDLSDLSDADDASDLGEDTGRRVQTGGQSGADVEAQGSSSSTRFGKRAAMRDASNLATKGRTQPAEKGRGLDKPRRRATMAAPSHQLPRPLSAVKQSRKSTGALMHPVPNQTFSNGTSASSTASPAPSDSPFAVSAGTTPDVGDATAGAPKLRRRTAAKVRQDTKEYRTTGLYDNDYHRDAIRWDMKKKGIGKLRRAASASSASSRSASPLPELPFLPEPLYGGIEILGGRRDFKLPKSLVNEQENLRARVDAKRKPPHYQHISKNRYVSRPKLQNAEIQVCNCNPASGCGDNCLNRRMEYICNPKSCPCGERCTNISLAKRPHARCDVQWYGKRGFGLVTRDAIAKDGLVDEYRGEVISMAEAIRRTNELYKDTGNFYFLDYDAPAGEVLDGGLKGNVTRFANHSCNPNCYIQKWILCGDGSQCSSEFQIGLFALRDIAAGEELTYDYGWSAFKSRTAAEEAVKRTPEACYCGADNCLGVLGGRRVANKANPPLPATAVAETSSVLGKRTRDGPRSKKASGAANGKAAATGTQAKRGRKPKSAKAPTVPGRHRLPLPRVSATPEPSNKPRYTNLGSRKAALALAARRTLPRPLSPESAAILMMKASNGELDESAVDQSWLDLPDEGEDSDEAEAARDKRSNGRSGRTRSQRNVASSSKGQTASSECAGDLNFYRNIYSAAQLEVSRQEAGSATEADRARGAESNSERSSTGTMTMSILKRAAKRIGLGAASATALAQYCRRGADASESAEPASSSVSGSGPSPSTAPNLSQAKQRKAKAKPQPKPKPKPRGRRPAVAVLAKKQRRMPPVKKSYTIMPASPPPPGLKRKSTVKAVLESAAINGSGSPEWSATGGGPLAPGSKRKIIYTSPKDIPAGITDPSGGFIPDLPSNLVDMGIMSKGDARRARNAYLARVRRFIKRGASEAEALELAAKMRSKGDENTPLFKAKLAATAAGVSPASLGVGDDEAAQHASMLASSGVSTVQLGAAIANRRDAARSA